MHIEKKRSCLEKLKREMGGGGDGEEEEEEEEESPEVCPCREDPAFRMITTSNVSHSPNFHSHAATFKLS